MRNPVINQRYEDMTLGIAVNGANEFGLPDATMEYPKLLNISQVDYNVVDGCCCENGAE